MHVLFLVNNFPEKSRPYAGIFVLNQAVAIAQVGHVVDVLYYDFRSIRRKRKWGLEHYKIAGINVFRYAIPCGPIENLHQWLLRNKTVDIAEKVIKEIGTPDILHAHFTDMGVAAGILKENFGIPIVLTEHSSLLFERFIDEGRRKKIQYAYQKADVLLAVSNVLKKHMEFFVKRKILVVPNILPHYFKYIYGVRREVPYKYVSIVGTATKEKGVDKVVRAFNVLNRRIPDISLEIYGEGLLIDELRKQTNSLESGSKICFHGIVENKELPQLLNRCHCFVLPSVMETFGVVYMEAIACGLPVVAVDAGGNMDIINERNGIIVERDSEEGLIEAMEYMYQNREQYKPEELSADIIGRFGVDIFTKRINIIYEEVKGSNL